MAATARPARAGGAGRFVASLLANRHPPRRPRLRECPLQVMRQPTGARSRLLVAAVIALAAAVVTGPIGAAADTYDEQLREAEQRADRAQDDLDALSAEASAVRDELVALEARLEDATGRLRTLEGQVALAEEELDQRTVVAEEAAAAAAAAAEELRRIEAELGTQEELLADQLAEAWIHGSTQGPALVYELLRTSRSPSDFAADLYRIETVLDAQAGVVEDVTTLRGQQVVAVDEARSARLRAERLRQEAADAVALVQGLRDQAAAVRADVQADHDRQQALLASLEQDADQARAVLASVAAEQDRIEAERQAEIAAAEEERRRQQERDAGGEGEGDGGGDGGGGGGRGSASASGPCPVDGARAERDFTNDWGYPRPGGRSHEGTDIFADRGTPVRSVGSGTVKEVRPYDGGIGGIFISIWVAEGEHWYYAHLDSVDPSLVPGVPVSDGQQIGTVGNTGNARTTPPHLHIGHYFNDVAENPYPVLASRCP